MPTITYRKLIKFGKGGAVITMPKGWVCYYELRAGDTLEVIADGELIVRPVKERLSIARRQTSS
jgi:bifunctional DNA-binding transcriptional regulator/antitoxin component of YhaV-PrlF toxin-antitoxin module